MHVSTTNRAVNGCARSWQLAVAAVAVAIVLLGVSACSGVGAPRVPPRPSGSPPGLHSAPPATGVEKVLVIVEENRSVSGCCGAHAVP